MTPISDQDVALQGTDWDVAVVGAGVAGTIAAREAARRGLKTVLIEARAFPRPKVCGGCLNPRALHVLSEIGLPNLVRDLRGEPFSGISLRSGKKTAFLRLPSGISVTRQCLDAALLEAARQAGAEIVTEASATVQPEPYDGFRQVTLTRQQQALEIRARVIVCADGLLRTSLHALPLMKTSHTAASRLGVGVVVGADTLSNQITSQIPHHRITMIVGQHGYVGLTWAELGQLSVAAAIDPRFIKSSGSPAAAVNEILVANGIQLPNCGGWHGTPSLTMTPHWNATERIFVIGDAAGYVEPFTGEGMAAALEEAVAIIPLVVQAAQQWQPSLATSWQRQHRAQFRKRQRICRAAAAILRRPWLSQMAMGFINAFPLPADYLINRIALPVVALPRY